MAALAHDHVMFRKLPKRPHSFKAVFVLHTEVDENVQKFPRNDPKNCPKEAQHALQMLQLFANEPIIQM